MIKLTEQQQQALDYEESPVRVVDPRTQVTYALIRIEDYERLRSLLDEGNVCATAEMEYTVMAQDDANDPTPLSTGNGMVKLYEPEKTGTGAQSISDPTSGPSPNSSSSSEQTIGDSEERWGGEVESSTVFTTGED